MVIHWNAYRRRIVDPAREMVLVCCRTARAPVPIRENTSYLRPNLSTDAFSTIARDASLASGAQASIQRDSDTVAVIPLARVNHLDSVAGVEHCLLRHTLERLSVGEPDSEKGIVSGEKGFHTGGHFPNRKRVGESARAFAGHSGLAKQKR